MKFDFNKVTEKINSFIDDIKTAIKEKKLNPTATVTLVIACILLFTFFFVIGVSAMFGSGDNNASESSSQVIIEEISIENLEQDLELNVGDVKDCLVEIWSDGECTRSDIVLVSVDRSVASFNPVSYDLGNSKINYIGCQITALSPGETNIYARNKDGAVMSESIHIVVKSSVDDENISQENTTTTTTTIMTSAPVADELSEKEAVSLVKEAISGQVGRDEKIESVTLKNRHLKIVADISNAELPNGFELSWIAEVRVSSITDAILELTQLDAYWDTITVVIEPVGSVTFDKSDILVNEYGGRYFHVQEDSFS